MGGVEPVIDEVEEDSQHVLRDQPDRSQRLVEIALHRDVEILVVGAGAMIREVEGLIDQRIHVDRRSLAARPARMRQH
jgi:hypothetical protein